MAELAALEMLCTGNCTVGSNPTLSARKRRQKAEGSRQKAAEKSAMRVHAMRYETPEVGEGELGSAFCLLLSAF